MRPAGGVVLREEGLLVHGLAAPAPVRGWMVVAPQRHVRALYDLDDGEAARVGALVARVMRAQRSALGAEHAYAMALGDVLPHAHVHVVPRFSDTPERLRGWRAFAAGAEDARPAAELEAAAEALRVALA